MPETICLTDPSEDDSARALGRAYGSVLTHWKSGAIDPLKAYMAILGASAYIAESVSAGTGGFSSGIGDVLTGREPPLAVDAIRPALDREAVRQWRFMGVPGEPGPSFMELREP